MEIDRPNRMHSVTLSDVEITGGEWHRRIEQMAKTVLPHQWEVLNDRVPGTEKSHAVENFRIAAGRSKGHFHGMRFQDSDVAKWIEAASHSLVSHPGKELEEHIEEVVELIREAQGADGYVNTYFTVAEPGGRWTDFSHGHELYCAGHMIEAAVAYLGATGKRSLLDVVERYVDYIASVIGPGEHKMKVYSGHPEIELALIKLYRATGEHKYLELCRYFIDERGRQPCFLTGESTFGSDFKDKWYHLDYHQAHEPIRRQRTIEGHAVRAMYLYAGAADLALETDDRGLRDTLDTLWRNLTSARMYVTGGVGSQAHGERFTTDYDLPNDRAYAESCAAIGVVFWAHRMLQLERRGSYGDVLERALYNGVLSGISEDGVHYFYANPLRVDPASVASRQDLSHVAVERQEWFGVACCPTNLARLICSVGQYIYSANDSELAVHLFVPNEAHLQLGSTRVSVRQETTYPREGAVRITLDPEVEADFKVSVRIPSWCRETEISVAGTPVEDVASHVRGGYFILNRRWTKGDVIEISFALPVLRLHADPRVAANVGRVALQRGPTVFCLEEVDNGKRLDEMLLPQDTELTASYEPELLGGVMSIHAKAFRDTRNQSGEELYSQTESTSIPVQLTAVPYRSWCNRAPGEMLVWIREG